MRRKNLWADSHIRAHFSDTNGTKQVIKGIVIGMGCGAALLVLYWIARKTF